MTLKTNYQNIVTFGEIKRLLYFPFQNIIILENIRI